MVDAKNQIRKIPSKIQDTTKDNQWLFVIVCLGIGILALGIIPPYAEMLVALGAAFIIAGGVGIYMMLATRQVAKKLHKRFNEQNEILESHTKILKENQKETSGILKEIASSQKDTSNSLKEIASSQKDTSNSLKDMTGILKRIEDKL